MATAVAGAGVAACRQSSPVCPSPRRARASARCWRLAVRVLALGAQAADHSSRSWMGGAPAGQVQRVFLVHSLFKSGRMRWVVVQQPALECVVIARELIGGVSTEWVVWESGEQGAPMGISPLPLTQLACSAGLLEQHRCRHLGLPPGLTVQQPLPPQGGVTVACRQQQGGVASLGWVPTPAIVRPKCRRSGCWGQGWLLPLLQPPLGDHDDSQAADDRPGEQQQSAGRTHRQAAVKDCCHSVGQPAALVWRE